MATPFNSSTAASRPAPASLGATSSRMDRMRGLVLRNHLGALEVEPEADLLQALLLHGMAKLLLVTCVEHEEAPAPGANQLPAQGAIRHRAVVPFVDVGVAHAAAARLLPLPVDVHEHGELLQVAGFEAVERLVAKLLRE